jgi:DNA helicase-2/ATP-dependent DNA helicase PcrA
VESLRRTDIIDYDDQKLLPLLYRWTVPQFDFLVIDEYQDTCPIESRLMLSACEHGRIIVFGDRNQAIYSFKGTTPDSMQEFAEKHSARLLPLSICYRCPKAVIREAQKIVPQIEWADDAIEGAVDTITKSHYKQTCTARDIVLARTTDDLVKSVIGFLAEGRAAYVEGREYGTQLKWFVEKHSDNQDNMDAETFKSRMDVHFSETHPELVKYNKEAQALALETKVDTIDVLIVGCQTVGDLRKKIDSIFTDKGVGIRHMTVHKSKGLQGHKDGDVHILRPDKLPHPRAKKPHLREEERRLKYVAQTRTRRNLYYVQKDKDEK